MARLKHHGGALFKCVRLNDDLAWCADGHVLRKLIGGEYKLWRTVVEADRKAALVRFQANVDRINEACPALGTYRAKLDELCDRQEIAYVHSLIEAMPTDCDGVWSMLDDLGHQFDLRDIDELCGLYRTARKQLTRYNTEKANEK